MRSPLRILPGLIQFVYANQKLICLGWQFVKKPLNGVQDNIFIERLWRTLNYQYLLLWPFNNGVELRHGLQRWFRFY